MMNSLQLIRRVSLFASSSSSRCRRSMIATARCLLPIKTVEVLSLRGENGQRARLVEQCVPIGTRVEAGDLVARLQTESTTDEQDEQHCEIRAPQNGQLVQMLVKLQDEVSIGDALFTIDTDEEDTLERQKKKEEKKYEQEVNKDTKALKEYLEEKKGDIDTFLADFMKSTDDIKRLRNMAFAIGGQFPEYRVKTLQIFERILELLENDEDDKETAQTHAEIGRVYEALGDLNAAVTHVQIGLDLRKAAKGVTAPDLLFSYIHLSALKQANGDLEGAFEDGKVALEIQRQSMGEKHRMVAVSLNDMGSLAFKMKRYKEATDFYKEALEISQKTYGEEHVDTAGVYHNLALAQQQTKDLADALWSANQALRIRTEVLGSKHPETANSHYCLTSLLADAGDLEAATEQCSAALTIQAKHYGNHRIPALTLETKGYLYYQQQKYDKALTDYRKALEMFKASLGGDQELHPALAEIHNKIGLCLAEKGDEFLDQALEEHQKACDIFAQKKEQEHPMLAPTISVIASILKRRGKLDEAVTEYRRAHKMLEKMHRQNHPDVASSLNNTAQALQLQKKYDESLELYDQALEIFERTLETKKHPHIASVHYNKGLAFNEMNDAAASRQEFETAREIWAGTLGPEHPQTKAAQQQVEACDKK